MERDCLTEEHQILTEDGFMFLEDLERNLPRIGSYNPESKTIVYEYATELIIKLAKTQQMVEVTQYAESSRWGKDSDPYGTDVRTDVHSNGISCVVTPNHDLYFKNGQIRTRSNGTNFIVWNGSEKKIDGKRKRYETDYAKYKAKSLLDMNKDCAIKLLSCAEGGVSVASNINLPFIKTLNLQTNEQISAFLELYGYWLGDGSLAFSAGGGRDSVVFSVVKKHDIKWLEKIFEILHLELDQEYKKSVSKKQVNLEIVDHHYVNMFHAEYRDKYYMGNPLFKRPTTVADRAKGVQPAKRRKIAGEPSTTEPKSAKWFMQWVWLLNKKYSRSVISGLRRADGSHARGDNIIYTSSVRFRDELVRLCLHAGYAPRFTLMYRAGTVRGIRNDVTIQAKYDNWRVSYADPDSHNPMFAKPTIHCERDVKTVIYTGRTWCVAVPHGFIITRRAHKENNIITKVSVPIIMGNCMLAHGASAVLEERLCTVSDPFQVPTCRNCGIITSSMTECQKCHSDEVVLCKIPYAAKQLVKELECMGLKLLFTPGK